ncbi:hypothetical protein CJ030_MR7G014374 [Morella rubra]|uniref:Uncharacterized protein n=1 Tax=Morella rubra TaxID=262757 RepID=A0A6A1V0P4_9ROSI|nr:hypothetical protein CJ030_MR7G014374 [Morella rubra]
MSLLLFGHPYPYEGGTLYTSDFSAENHVVSRIALTNLFPIAHLSSISFSRVQFLYALLIGDTIDICSVICSHMIELTSLTNQSLNLIKIVMRHQRQLKRHTLTLARHARATERNTRAFLALHRLIRPLVGADALSRSFESSASTGASAPSSEVPAADSAPVANPPPSSSTPVADPSPASSILVADPSPPTAPTPMLSTGTEVLSSHSSPATVVLSSPFSSAVVDSVAPDASTPPLDD